MGLKRAKSVALRMCAVHLDDKIATYELLDKTDSWLVKMSNACFENPCVGGSIPPQATKTQKPH
jgi:hypothetical protein